MAKNKHTKSTWRTDNNFRKCPKSKCTGTLIHCRVQYRPHGPVVDELECSECSLVKKNSNKRK